MTDKNLSLEEEFEEEEFEDDLLDEVKAEIYSSYVKVAADNATKLAQIIVENHHRKNEALETAEIIQIYNESFTAVLQIMVEVHELDK